MNKVRFDSAAGSNPSAQLPRLGSRRAKSCEFHELTNAERFDLSFGDALEPLKKQMLWLDPVYRISVTPPAFNTVFDNISAHARSKYLSHGSLKPLASKESVHLIAKSGTSERDNGPHSAVHPHIVLNRSIKSEFFNRLEQLKNNDSPIIDDIAGQESLHAEFLNRALREVGEEFFEHSDLLRHIVNWYLEIPLERLMEARKVQWLGPHKEAFEALESQLESAEKEAQNNAHLADGAVGQKKRFESEMRACEAEKQTIKLKLERAENQWRESQLLYSHAAQQARELQELTKEQAQRLIEVRGDLERALKEVIKESKARTEFEKLLEDSKARISQLESEIENLKPKPSTNQNNARKYRKRNLMILKAVQAMEAQQQQSIVKNETQKQIFQELTMNLEDDVARSTQQHSVIATEKALETIRDGNALLKSFVSLTTLREKERIDLAVKLDQLIARLNDADPFSDSDSEIDENDKVLLPAVMEEIDASPEVKDPFLLLSNWKAAEKTLKLKEIELAIKTSELDAFRKEIMKLLDAQDQLDKAKLNQEIQALQEKHKGVITSLQRENHELEEAIGELRARTMQKEKEFALLSVEVEKFREQFVKGLKSSSNASEELNAALDSLKIKEAQLQKLQAELELRSDRVLGLESHVLNLARSNASLKEELQAMATSVARLEIELKSSSLPPATTTVHRDMKSVNVDTAELLISVHESDQRVLPQGLSRRNINAGYNEDARNFKAESQEMTQWKDELAATKKDRDDLRHEIEMLKKTRRQDETKRRTAIALTRGAQSGQPRKKKDTPSEETNHSVQQIRPKSRQHAASVRDLLGPWAPPTIQSLPVEQNYGDIVSAAENQKWHTVQQLIHATKVLLVKTARKKITSLSPVSKSVNLQEAVLESVAEVLDEKESQKEAEDFKEDMSRLKNAMENVSLQSMVVKSKEITAKKDSTNEQPCLDSSAGASSIKIDIPKFFEEGDNATPGGHHEPAGVVDMPYSQVVKAASKSFFNNQRSISGQLSTFLSFSTDSLLSISGDSENTDTVTKAMLSTSHLAQLARPQQRISLLGRLTRFISTCHSNVDSVIGADGVLDASAIQSLLVNSGMQEARAKSVVERLVEENPREISPNEFALGLLRAQALSAFEELDREKLGKIPAETASNYLVSLGYNEDEMGEFLFYTDTNEDGIIDANEWVTAFCHHKHATFKRGGSYSALSSGMVMAATRLSTPTRSLRGDRHGRMSRFFGPFDAAIQVCEDSFLELKIPLHHRIMYPTPFGIILEQKDEMLRRALEEKEEIYNKFQEQSAFIKARSEVAALNELTADAMKLLKGREIQQLSNHQNKTTDSSSKSTFPASMRDDEISWTQQWSRVDDEVAGSEARSDEEVSVPRVPDLTTSYPEILVTIQSFPEQKSLRELIETPESFGNRHPRSVQWLYKTLHAILEDKIISDAVDVSRNLPIQNMPIFIRNWMKTRFGVETLARQNCWDLYHTVLKVRNDSALWSIIAGFCDCSYSLAQQSAFLHGWSLLQKDRDSKDAKFEPHYVRAEKALAIGDQIFPYASAEEVKEFSDIIANVSFKFNAQHPGETAEDLFIEQNAVLACIVNYRSSLRRSFHDALRRGFSYFDTADSGHLSLQSVSKLVLGIVNIMTAADFEKIVEGFVPSLLLPGAKIDLTTLILLDDRADLCGRMCNNLKATIGAGLQAKPKGRNPSSKT